MDCWTNISKIYITNSVSYFIAFIAYPPNHQLQYNGAGTGEQESRPSFLKVNFHVNTAELHHNFGINSYEGNVFLSWYIKKKKTNLQKQVFSTFLLPNKDCKSCFGDWKRS